MINKIQKILNSSIENKQDLSTFNAQVLFVASNICDVLNSHNKILIAAFDKALVLSDYLQNILINGLNIDRPGFAAIKLSQSANDDVNLLLKQIATFGFSGDIIFLITTQSSKYQDILDVINHCEQLNIRVVLLANEEMSDILDEVDDEFVSVFLAPTSLTSLTNEAHLFFMHAILNMVEHILFEGVDE